MSILRRRNRISELEPNDLVPLAEFARYLGSSYWTVRRWWIDGTYDVIRSKIVRLEVKKTAHGMATSRQMYEKFINDLNSPGD